MVRQLATTERKKIIKRLDKLAKEYAKERDNYVCQHCGVQCTKSNAHGSHVIPVSSGNRLRWDENNIKCLCFHCHMNWWHKNPTESGDWFKQKFPTRWKYLEKEKSKGLKKWTIEELLEIEDRYKNLIQMI
jgi:5-methylcytosine-specific restriction endonuclease McrA